MSAPEIRVGTSGWNYRHWRGVFYPGELRQQDWLGHYAASFDTVEINATFYRLPKPEHVKNWAGAVPERFLFAVKGSRFLTHMMQLRQTGEPLDRFFDVMSGLGKKAGPVLWQLPPRLQRDDDRLAAFVGDLPGAWRHAFEFRHASWFCREVYDILERSNAALCIGDHPERSQPVVMTADWTYLRFHYGKDDGRYSQRQLEGWSRQIHEFAGAGAGVFAYFNNDQQGFALENARDLRGMLAIASRLS